MSVVKDAVLAMKEVLVLTDKVETDRKNAIRNFKRKA